MTFPLDPQLAADTLAIGELPLCAVRLMNDRRFPWLILVPRRPDAAELFDLPPDDRAVLIEEVTRAAAALRDLTAAVKMNVAALGNQVRQLHVHVVARTTSDPAWPKPVWGVGAPIPYPAAEAATMIARLAGALDLR